MKLTARTREFVCPRCMERVEAFEYSNGVTIPLCPCHGYIYNDEGRPADVMISIGEPITPELRAYLERGPLTSKTRRKNLKDGLPEFDGEHRIQTHTS